MNANDGDDDDDSGDSADDKDDDCVILWPVEPPNDGPNTNDRDTNGNKGEDR